MFYTGSIIMFVCMVITGIIVAKFQHDWPNHVAAGWTAVGMSPPPILQSFFLLRISS